MNEIERTIRELQLYVDVRWGRSNDMFNLALTALREKAERSKGCRYCNTTQNRYLTDDVYMATINSYGDKQRVLTSNNGMQYKTLGFCPSCGKRLEVERDG
jgi:hypothetical protein